MPHVSRLYMSLELLKRLDRLIPGEFYLFSCSTDKSHNSDIQDRCSVRVSYLKPRHVCRIHELPIINFNKLLHVESIASELSLKAANHLEFLKSSTIRLLVS